MEEQKKKASCAKCCIKESGEKRTLYGKERKKESFENLGAS